MTKFTDLSPSDKAGLSRWLAVFYAKLGSLAVHAQSLGELDAQYQAVAAPVLAKLEPGAAMPDITFLLTAGQIAAFMANVESMLAQRGSLPELMALYRRS